MTFKDLKEGDKIYYLLYSTTYYYFETKLYIVQSTCIKDGFLKIKYTAYPSTGYTDIINIPLHKINGNCCKLQNLKFYYTSEKQYLKAIQQQLNKITKTVVKKPELIAVSLITPE